MYNLEKLLIFVSDKQLMDEMITSLQGLSDRSKYCDKVDVKKVEDKLKNIRKLCLEKQ